MNSQTENTQVVVDLDQFAVSSSAQIFDPNPESGPGTNFQFEMCHKQTNLGGLEIDQWWMDKRGLYGERNKESPNRLAVANCFWALCLLEGSALDDKEVQESYILTSLLPHARSNGSRRVFVDASMIRREKKNERQSLLEELEEMLALEKGNEKDILSFYRTTADMLGPPAYEADVWKCYEEFLAELMDDTCESLSRNGMSGLDIALARWVDRMRTIGRRSGHTVEKCVLDMLSYECRAALHRCYSAVWLLLMKKLAAEHDWTDETVLFHKLWHLDQVIPSNETLEANFHIFHGHLFGLHPASSDLICTPTGRELLGELIAEPDDQSCHRRFLNGMLVAICDYARRNEVCKELRKKQPEEAIQGDVELTEVVGFDRKEGRRSKGRRKTDAR